ncbi:MAG: hypothetical protein K6E40_13700 [Desulfovibrio sp.]|nr:hypothetical protein [Desulfovibrio sp.]
MASSNESQGKRVDKALAVIAGVSIAVAIAGTAVGFRANVQTEEYLASALAWKEQADDFKARLSVAKGQLADAEKRIAEARSGLTRNERLILAACEAGKPGTLAFKNRNPCNVKKLGNGQKWRGQVGVDSQGHVVFSSIHYGLRAFVLTMRSYQTRHGIKTLEALIERYCGGNPDYVAYLSRRLRLKPDEEFRIIPRIPELARWMSTYESGREVDPSLIATLDILARI